MPPQRQLEAGLAAFLMSVSSEGIEKGSELTFGVFTAFSASRSGRHCSPIASDPLPNAGQSMATSSLSLLGVWPYKYGLTFDTATFLIAITHPICHANAFSTLVTPIPLSPSRHPGNPFRPSLQPGNQAKLSPCGLTEKLL